MQIDVGAGLHSWKDDVGCCGAQLDTDNVVRLVSDIEDECLEKV